MLGMFACHNDINTSPKVGGRVVRWYYNLDYSRARGWSGGAKVLGKLPVPGHLINLDYRRARAYCACSRCGWGVVWTFFLSAITSLFFLPLSGRRPDID